MLTPKKTKIICHVCGKEIRGARTVIDGSWHCSDCAYKHDYPDREVPEATAHTRAPRYDGPTLFETTGYIKPKRQQEHDDRP